MALTKTNSVTSIEVLGNNFVQIHTQMIVWEDEKQLSVTNETKTIMPGDDVSQEDAKTQAICAAVHTPEIIATHQATWGTAKAEV